MWECLWYKVRARGEDLKHVRCTVSEAYAEGGLLFCASRSRKPSACLIISNDRVCGRTQNPQPHHTGLKQPRSYHRLGWHRGAVLCWLLLRGFHCANSDPGLQAGMSFAVFHFSSLFTLFTKTHALFLLCLLCINQHFTGDSLIPTTY